MQTVRGLVSSQPGHLQALRAKHAALKEQIGEELKHPTADDVLKRMKREKLMLKDEIEQELQKVS